MLEFRRNSLSLADFLSLAGLEFCEKSWKKGWSKAGKINLDISNNPSATRIKWTFSDHLFSRNLSTPWLQCFSENRSSDSFYMEKLKTRTRQFLSAPLFHIIYSLKDLLHLHVMAFHDVSKKWSFQKWYDVLFYALGGTGG